MNKLLLLLSIVLFCISCSEKEPPGLEDPGTKVIDSTYVAPLEAKQDKVVFVEELTGVKCRNCPQAATILKQINDANPGRILVAGMHPPSSTFTVPISGKSIYDFRQPKADEIGIKLGGLGNFPSASLNRIPIATGDFFDKDRGAWSSRIDPWLLETTPININIESSYTADNNTCQVVTKVAFTEDVTEDLYLTIYVLENDIEDYQDNDGVKELYMHQHVFRDCITSISGTSLNTVDKNAGRVIQKVIAFNPVTEGINGWNLDNCKILAFVHKSGTDQAVLHAQQVKLK